MRAEVLARNPGTRPQKELAADRWGGAPSWPPGTWPSALGVTGAGLAESTDVPPGQC